MINIHQKLKEHYALTTIAHLATGGFKRVCQISKDDKTEVLKLISLSQSKESSSTQEKRITQEIEILKECKSKFLVKLGSLISPASIEIEGEKYFVYSEEFLKGHDLSKADNPFTWDEVKTLLFCICEALSELHQKKKIHRDIKPANIMKLTSQDRPYVLIDLGIAFDEAQGGFTTLQLAPGTLGYTAPELLEQYYKENLSATADIYSLGVTLYECITRQKYKPSNDIRITGDFPSELCDILKICLKQKPYLRFQNIEELMERIKAIK